MFKLFSIFSQPDVEPKQSLEKEFDQINKIAETRDYLERLLNKKTSNKLKFISRHSWQETSLSLRVSYFDHSPFRSCDIEDSMSEESKSVFEDFLMQYLQNNCKKITTEILEEIKKEIDRNKEAAKKNLQLKLQKLENLKT